MDRKVGKVEDIDQGLDGPAAALRNLSNIPLINANPSHSCVPHIRMGVLMESQGQ